MSNFINIENELNDGVLINLDHIISISFNSINSDKLIKTFFKDISGNVEIHLLTPEGVNGLFKFLFDSK